METKWGENPNLASAFGDGQRAGADRTKYCGNNPRARDSLSDHKRPKSGKVWKGTPPLCCSSQIGTAQAFTDPHYIPILCSLWLYRYEVLCALASGLTATGRAGPTPGGGPAPRWWLTQLCLLAITHLSSTGHQGQQGQPYKRNPTPRVHAQPLHYQPINLSFSSSRL